MVACGPESCQLLLFKAVNSVLRDLLTFAAVAEKALRCEALKMERVRCREANIVMVGERIQMVLGSFLELRDLNGAVRLCCCENCCIRSSADRSSCPDDDGSDLGKLVRSR